MNPPVQVPIMSLDEFDTPTYHTEVHQILDDLDLCDCGFADRYTIILSILQGCETYVPYDSSIPQQIHSLIEFIIDVMNSSKWNLLEHGGSVGGSWLSDRGETLLKFLTEHGTDSQEWPDWAL